MSARHTLVPFRRAVRAELARTSGSAAAFVPLAGLLLCLLQGVAWWGVATRPLSGWEQMFGWQSLYATGLLGPLAALAVGSAVARERRARDGGTGWRALTPATALAARAVVLALVLCALDLAVTMPLLLFGWAHGLTAAPVARLAGVWLALWLGSLLPAGVAFVVARVAGGYLAVGVAVVGQVLGTVQAETSTWFFRPWTWPVRAVLPLLGVHANGLALEPGSPVWHWHWWTALGLAVSLAVVITVLGNRVGPPARSPRRRLVPVTLPAVPSLPLPVAAEPAALPQPNQVAAVATSLRGTAIAPLTLAALGAVALTALIWDADHVQGLVTWLIVPFGTCLLGCLIWAAQSPAWRVVSLRAPGGGLGLVVLGWCLGLTTLVIASTAAVLAARGGAHVVRFGLVSWAVGAAWVTLSLFLACRLGAGAAVGLTLVMLVVALVFGGTSLARTQLWLVGLLAWPVSGDSWPRAGEAVALAAAVTLIAGLAWTRALRRAARL